MEKHFKLSDNVISRVAQILQEGILLGVDIVDLLRQIEVVVDTDGTTLVMSAEYAKQVLEMHEKLLTEINTKRMHAEAESFAAEIASKRSTIS